MKTPIRIQVVFLCLLPILACAPKRELSAPHPPVVMGDCGLAIRECEPDPTVSGKPDVDPAYGSSYSPPIQPADRQDAITPKVTERIVPAHEDALRTGRAAIMQAPPGQFVIQLAANHSLADLNQLAVRLGIGGGVKIPIMSGGDVWYALILDIYPDEASARNTVESLPPNMVQLRPWVRSVDSLQAAVRAAWQALDLSD